MIFYVSTMFRVLAVLSPLALAAGCAPLEGPESSESGQPMTDGEEPTGGEAVCHQVTSLCFDTEYTPFTCETPSPCDALEVNDPAFNEGDPDPYGFVNPQAATCIAEGLRDGTVGTYVIRVEPGQQYSVRYELELLADGTLITRKEFSDDDCLDYDEWWELPRAPAHFDGCLAEADEEAMLDCLVDAGDDAQCVAAAPVCPGA